ncbi:MAG: Hsp33 family molecular chaperone HslO [Clostridia bacterium]|nr:Hsp33 family molecular chaperone HslO [Clostridia bacterium]
MADIFKRGTSMDGGVRVFAAVTTDLVNEAQKIHHTYPVATAALGRTLTAGVLMAAAGLKNDTDSLTIQVKGDGPLGNIVVCADSSLKVRGYVANPYVDRPLNEKGKLDVGGAVGKGVLNVIRDLGMKEPYIGQIPLVSGEIAEDITMYYAQSEQIPTAVALGVLVDTDNSVIASGGFMIQMMPGSTDEEAKLIEKTLDSLPPVTSMIAEGKSAEDIIFDVVDGIDFLIENEEGNPVYKCNCSKSRMEKALISIGKQELSDIISEQGEAELCCQFCDNKYKFSKEELTELLTKATKK